MNLHMNIILLTVLLVHDYVLTVERANRYGCLMDALKAFDTVDQNS